MRPHETIRSGQKIVKIFLEWLEIQIKIWCYKLDLQAPVEGRLVSSIGRVRIGSGLKLKNWPISLKLDFKIFGALSLTPESNKISDKDFSHCQDSWLTNIHNFAQKRRSRVFKNRTSSIPPSPDFWCAPFGKYHFRSFRI